MKALLAQKASVPDLEQNLNVVVSTLRQAPGVDLVVFPELFLSGYEATAAAGRALKPESQPMRDLAAVCRETKTSLIVGFCEGIDGGKFANSLACIDGDGLLQGVYRKVQLFGGAEKEVFSAGSSLFVACLEGVRVGCLICFDLEFPEHARALAEAGIDMLVTVAANMSPYGPDHELHARARAVENRVPHLYVNRVGGEAGLRFVGESRVISADGSVVEELGAEPGELLADLEVPAPAPPADVDYLDQLRTGMPVRSAIAD